MRIPINLASHPLENLRPLRTAILLAAIAAVLLSAVLVRREWRQRIEFRSLIQQQSSVEAALRNLRAEQGELESWLSTPQAQQIRERSAFLNSIILRKGLSWTQLFMDLEEILPPQARILAISPSLNQREEVDLNLTVSAASMEPLVRFLKNLESSSRFGPPVVGAQRYQTGRAAGEGIALDLTARYRQARPSLPATATEPRSVEPAIAAGTAPATAAEQQETR